MYVYKSFSTVVNIHNAPELDLPNNSIIQFCPVVIYVYNCLSVCFISFSESSNVPGCLVCSASVSSTRLTWKTVKSCNKKSLIT